MDLFPILKLSLFLFSGLMICFLLVSFFAYKLRNFSSPVPIPEDFKDSQLIPQTKYFTREDIVHSVAIPENGSMEFIQIDESRPRTEQNYQNSYRRIENRYQVFNTPVSKNIMNNYSYQQPFYKKS